MSVKSISEDMYECTSCGSTFFKSLGTVCPDCGTEVVEEEEVTEEASVTVEEAPAEEEPKTKETETVVEEAPEKEEPKPPE